MQSPVKYHLIIWFVVPRISADAFLNNIIFIVMLSKSFLFSLIELFATINYQTPFNFVNAHYSYTECKLFRPPLPCRLLFLEHHVDLLWRDNLLFTEPSFDGLSLFDRLVWNWLHSWVLDLQLFQVFLQNVKFGNLQQGIDDRFFRNSQGLSSIKRLGSPLNLLFTWVEFWTILISLIWHRFSDGNLCFDGARVRESDLTLKVKFPH